MSAEAALDVFYIRNLLSLVRNTLRAVRSGQIVVKLILNDAEHTTVKVVEELLRVHESVTADGATTSARGSDRI
jgi:urease accessory protein UreF